MLPLHGQSTAAVKMFTGQVRLHIFFRHGAMFLINRQNTNLPSSFQQFHNINWNIVYFLAYYKPNLYKYSFQHNCSTLCYSSYFLIQSKQISQTSVMNYNKFSLIAIFRLKIYLLVCILLFELILKNLIRLLSLTKNLAKNLIHDTSISFRKNQLSSNADKISYLFLVFRKLLLQLLSFPIDN